MDSDMKKSITSSIDQTDYRQDDREDDVPLPGFRFHPTDEELVGFYLRRKVEKRAISIELIKQIDIYKYDPWDLPKASNVGDKEWYFFCRRGRKYRNSIRPNRVTGSGFWKATGIDRPIYGTSGRGGGSDCIGLKKSLVYYRGSAGKGTKTDWMMHEFRLPPDDHNKTTKQLDHAITIAQEAEVWTLCRILKRCATYRKSVPDWKELYAKRNNASLDSSSKTCSIESDNGLAYISFRAPGTNEKKPFTSQISDTNQLLTDRLSSTSQAPSTASYSSFVSPDVNDFLKHGDWDELRSIVGFVADPFFV
ncbi:hypothetical protein RJ639_000859 [Escallonia herrerae]|uniref:NAC domain-containing protein n=1 Tax=Escallonia herrerae TaxID=1293975 RepID=A0AA88X9P2_9ASTE|nr:hypothetical protein RJ639_000859 [Escallonia herrerae]